MKHYDYIIAGGGLSGTLLLYLFLKSPLKNNSFLIIDKNMTKHPRRQWSFWTKSVPFDSIISKKWNLFDIRIEHFQKDYSLAAYTIYLLESHKYFKFISEMIHLNPQVTVLEDEIVSIENNQTGATVRTKNDTYTANYVFDSTSLSMNPSHINRTLWMQGGSFFVETKDTIFNPAKMTFMDVLSPFKNKVFFYYVLPLSLNQAFVETAQINARKEEQNYNQHEQLVIEYLERRFQLKKFAIQKVDFGSIPLIDGSFSRYDGAHIVRIGAKGGLIKSTTSYALTSILKDNQMIVNSFIKYRKPKQFYTRNVLIRFLDSAMLELMEKNPQAVQKMYDDLFRTNSKGDDMLAYLSEELSVLKMIQLMKNVDSKAITEIIKQCYNPLFK